MQMDEYNRGMDPELKRYFRKIAKSFFFGLLWLMVVATAGIYFRLGYVGNGIRWYQIVFYLLSLLSFIWLLRYLYLIWREKDF